MAIDRTFATTDDLTDYVTTAALQADYPTIQDMTDAIEAIGGGNVTDIGQDTDNNPYLTGAVGTAGSEFAYDTDGIPYLI